MEMISDDKNTSIKISRMVWMSEGLNNWDA